MGRRVRVAVTNDGDYVPDTDVNAAHLVYIGDIDDAPRPIKEKMAGPSEDKAARKTADKSRQRQKRE